MKITASQLRKIIKEEVEAMMPAAGSKDPQRFLHGFESGHPMDDEGYMIKSRMSDVKDMAKTICQLLEPGDQLPAWVQDLVASAHTDLEHVKDYLENDEKMRSYDKTAMPMGEARRRKAKALKEGHARISNTEFAAWSRGDWGFVMEGPAGMKEMTAAAAKAFISSKDGTETSPDDIVDVDTGEIYLSAGEAYGSSDLHPDADARLSAAAAARAKAWEEDEEELHSDGGLQAEWEAALHDFAANYGSDSGIPFEDAASAAMDLADNFFHEHPEWRTWASALEMTKADMKSAVAEAVHEAMTA
jgi:hypothetical protein